MSCAETSPDSCINYVSRGIGSAIVWFWIRRRCEYVQRRLTGRVPCFRVHDNTAVVGSCKESPTPILKKIRSVMLTGLIRCDERKPIGFHTPTWYRDFGPFGASGYCYFVKSRICSLNCSWNRRASYGWFSMQPLPRTDAAEYPVFSKTDGSRASCFLISNKYTLWLINF